MLNSYPSIYNLGHSAIKDLLKTPVLVQEKVDGSQFSFGIDENGELGARSKGARINLEAPEKMFAAAIESIKLLVPVLHRGWVYRGEYLAKEKHNALVYARVPKSHIILFDINTGLETYLSYDGVVEEAARIGLEVVPKLFEGIITDIQEFRAFLDTTSVLGGQKIEGVVVKPVGYGLFGRDKKCLMGKFVSEAFKEVHSGAWKEANPSSNDIVERLTVDYQTQARWQKAVLHLAERGELENSPKDIGKLMKEVGTDVDKECQDAIKEVLWRWAWPKLQRGISRGLPDWYKNELLKRQFAVAGESCNEKA